MRLRLSAISLVILGVGPAFTADLTPIVGPKVSGTLRQVDGESVGITTPDGAVVKTPVKAVRHVDFDTKPLSLTPDTNRDRVELVDGSVLVCTGLRIIDKTVELDLLAGPDGIAPPKLALPLSAVLTIMRGAEDPARVQAWKELVAGRGKRDLFVIRQATGLNPLSGTVLGGNETGDRINFELEVGGQRLLPLSRASGGLVFNQPPRDLIPETICKVVDAFGNATYAHRVEFAEPEVRVTTVSGASLVYPSVSGLVRLDFSKGNIAYLSDLSPVVDSPAVTPGEPAIAYLNDRALGGDAITIDGNTFVRGLWVNAETNLTYDLGADYREFKASLGIDDRVPVADAAVRVVIEADGRELFAGRITRGDKPQAITLDVKNATSLRIAVDRDGLYMGNHLVLGDARLQK